MAFSLTDYKKKKSEEEGSVGNGAAISTNKGFSLSDYHSGAETKADVDNTDNRMNQWFSRYNSLVNDFNDYEGVNKTSGWANKAVSNINQLGSQVDELKNYYSSHVVETDSKYGKGYTGRLLKDIESAQSGLESMLEGTISYRQATNPNYEAKMESAAQKLMGNILNNNLKSVQRGNLSALPTDSVSYTSMDQLKLDTTGADLDKQIAEKKAEVNKELRNTTDNGKNTVTLSSSYTQLRDELSALEEERSKITEEQNNRIYQSYMAKANMPGFEEDSKYVSTKYGEPQYDAITGTYIDSGYGDIDYEIANRNADALNLYNVNERAVDESKWIPDRVFDGEPNTLQLTDDELKVYNYLYSQDKEQANRFVSFLNSDLNVRQRNEATERIENYIEQGRGNEALASVYSVLSSPMKVVSAAGQVFDMADDGKIDQNAAYNRWAYQNTAIRNKVSQDIQERHVDDSGLTNFWGKAGSFAYQTGMSMADFIYNAAITGAFGGELSTSAAENLSLAIMGSGAGADATIEAKDRGLSDSQAFAIGTVAGLAEIVTEKVSLDKLLDTAAAGKGSLTYLMSNTIAEGSEEVASDLINWASDVIIAWDKSEWEEAIQKYMTDGGVNSRDKAFTLALKDKLLEMGQSFLGGALSGFAMSSAPVAFNNIVSAYDIQQNGEQGQLIESMLSENPNSIAYKTAANMNPGDMSYLDMLKSVAASDITESAESIRADRATKRAEREIKSKGWVSNDTLDEALYGNNVLEKYNIDPTDTVANKRSKLETALKAFINGNETHITEDTTNVSTVEKPAEKVNFKAEAAARQIEDQRIVEYAQKNMGDVGKASMQDAYRGGDTIDFIKTYTQNYQQGVKAVNDTGVDVKKLKTSDTVSRAQAVDAFRAGQMDAAINDGGIDYESNGRGLQGNTQVGGREGSYKVSGKTGKAQAWRGNHLTGNEAESIKQASQKVSAKELGVSTGTDTKNVYQVKRENYTSWMNKIEHEGEALGVTVKFFVGDSLEVKKGNKTVKARGAHSGNTVWVRADHAELTAEQIFAHEMFHEYERRSGNVTEFHEKILEKMREKYSEAEMEELVTDYIEAYGWEGRTEEDIYSEILADAFAGIDIFDYLQRYEGATRFDTKLVQQYVNEVNEDTNQMNAPPNDKLKLSEDNTSINDSKVGHTEKENKVIDAYKGRLKELPEAEYKGMQAALEGKINTLVQEIADYNSTSTWDINDAFMDSARGRRTITSITNAYAQYGMKINNDLAKKSQELFNEAAEIPSKYFEAKAHRVVGFNEIVEALIPETASNKLVSALEERGVSYQKYTDNDDRIAKLRAIDNVRFSEETDKEYLNLAKDPEGNKAKLQAIIDNAAEQAGYPIKAYHGTALGGFTTYDFSKNGLSSGVGRNIISLTDNADVAKAFAGEDSKGRNKAIRKDAVERELVDTFNKLFENGSLNKDELSKLFFSGNEVSAWDVNAIADSVNEYMEYDEDADSNAIDKAETEAYYKYLKNTLEEVLPNANSDLKNEIRNTLNELDKVNLEGNGTATVYEWYIPAPEKEYYANNQKEYQEVASEAGNDGTRCSAIHLKGEGTRYFVKSNTDIKSAELVTYDDNGKVIPLSERFNQDSNDIRYSAETEADLKKQNKKLITQINKLNESLNYYKGQLKITPENAWKTKDARIVAKDFSTRYMNVLKGDDLATLTKDVQELGEMFKGDKECTNESFIPIKEKAVEIAEAVLDGAKELVQSVDQEAYDYVRAELSGGVSISEQGKRDFKDGWGRWIKDNYGTIRIRNAARNVDSVYADLMDRYPDIFTEQTSEHGELDEIVGFLKDREPVYKNPFDRDWANAVECAANDLLASIISSKLEAPVTFADRAQKKLDKAIASDKAKAEKIDQLRKELADMKAEYQTNTRNRIDKVRQNRDEKIEALKQHYREVNENKAWRKMDSEARQKLLKIAKRLSNKKLPAYNKAALNEILGNLDTIAVSMTGKRKAELEWMSDWYNHMIEEDPDARDANIEKQIERLSKKQIATLSYEEILAYTKVLLGFENMIKNNQKLIDTADRRNVYNQATETTANIKNTEGYTNSFGEHMLTESLSPLRLIRRVTGYVESDPLYKSTLALQEGQQKQEDYVRKANITFNQWISDKDFMNSLRGKNAETVEITGTQSGQDKTIRITRDMLLALYMHSLNPDNIKHIANGGITVPNLEELAKGKVKKAWDDVTTIKLNPANIREVVSNLTDKEKKFCDAVWTYFNVTSKDAINETAEKLLGYSLADVENYFPINTNTDFTKKEIDALKKDGTIEGMGILKERVKASQPIYLRGLTDVLTKSIDQHAKYYGLAIPVRNFNKLWNVTFSDYNTLNDGTVEVNSFTDSVKAAVRKKWHSETVDYIENMLADIQSPRKSGKDRLNVFRGNYAGAVLSLNFSVAIKQAASYPTAGAVLGAKPLMKALTSFEKVDLDLIAKYTPLLWYRSLGFSTTELGDLAKGKQVPVALNWIQGADIITTRKLWRASEIYIEDNIKDLKSGTDEFYQAVAEVYNRVITETQPNYTTMERPEVLRSDDTIIRNTVAMFKTQPLQNFNIVYDAFGNLHAKKRAYEANKDDSLKVKLKEELTEAKKTAARAVASQVVQNAVFSAMTALWAFIRKKTDRYENDEGDVTLGSFAKAFGLDMLSGGLSAILYAGDAYDFIKSMITGESYYGIEALSVQSISDALEGLVNIRQQFEEETDRTEKVIDASYDAAMNIANLIGIPANNVANIFKAIAAQAFSTQGKYVGAYLTKKYDKTQYTYDSQYYQNLWEAYSHRTGKHAGQYEELYQMMLDDGFDESKMINYINSMLKEEKGVDKVSELGADRFAGMNANYDKIIDSMQGVSGYSSLDEETVTKLNQLAYSIAIDSKGKETLIEKYTSQGITDEEYMLFQVALRTVDEPNSKGNMGTFDTEEVKKALEKIYGTGKNQDAAALYEIQTGSKNNPFK